ncbi:MAG: hypothetical protein IV108_10460 [Burkholderiales bacterium]|nr:hypothetical protein [Burkholderiales bacterium]
MTTPSQINPPRNSRRQRGAAILIMVLILMLGLITLFTFRMDRRGPELEADRKTALALAQAKEALIGKSATNNVASGTENPGSMPCPDQDNDGGWGKGLPPPSLLATCPSSANVGRLPWYFLQMEELRDGSSENLWLVVDPAFIDRGNPINTNTLSTLTVDGNSVIVAIVAPGSAIAGQNRTGAGVNLPANYLENYTSPITTLPLSAAYNDRILTITAKELFTVVTQRMVREFVKKLAGMGYVTYYPSSYPFPIPPASLPLPLDVWDENEWYSVAVYTPLSATQFKLQFAKCASVFTVTWNGVSSIISRSGSC